MLNTTYDVRVFAIETRTNKNGEATSYRVRWRTGTKQWHPSFKKWAQADAFRSTLITATRQGEAFSLTTGKPVSWDRAAKAEVSWYTFACAYVDMKWKGAAAKYRQDIARALTAATPAMVQDGRGKPDDKELRAAMHRWGFNTKDRENAPEDAARVLRWLAENTRPVTDLATPSVARGLLTAGTSRLNGKSAAANTARKHRMLLSNAMDYAVEKEYLKENPIRLLKWKAPRSASAVDRRSVVNHTQARALLAAVKGQEPSGERLVAFFALMYYAALRPEEAMDLHEDDVTLKDLVLNEDTGQMEEPDDDWGEIYLGAARPFVGGAWTDDGAAREERALKHRPEGVGRPVPSEPALSRILRWHIDNFGGRPDGRFFYGVRGGDLPPITYRRVWGRARKVVLTPAEVASPLAKRPYDLRHAGVSTWLNAGVPATQVAEWAGQSVEVLLRFYAKCIDGQEKAALRRIAQAREED